MLACSVTSIMLEMFIYRTSTYTVPMFYPYVYFNMRWFVLNNVDLLVLILFDVCLAYVLHSLIPYNSKWCFMKRWLMSNKDHFNQVWSDVELDPMDHGSRRPGPTCMMRGRDRNHVYLPGKAKNSAKEEKVRYVFHVAMRSASPLHEHVMPNTL